MLWLFSCGTRSLQWCHILMDKFEVEIRYRENITVKRRALWFFFFSLLVRSENITHDFLEHAPCPMQFARREDTICVLCISAQPSNRENRKLCSGTVIKLWFNSITNTVCRPGFFGRFRTHNQTTNIIEEKPKSMRWKNGENSIQLLYCSIRSIWNIGSEMEVIWPEIGHNVEEDKDRVWTKEITECVQHWHKRN